MTCLNPQISLALQRWDKINLSYSEEKSHPATLKNNNSDMDMRANSVTRPNILSSSFLSTSLVDINPCPSTKFCRKKNGLGIDCEAVESDPRGYPIYLHIR